MLFDLEVELGGETYRPQHPHRVFQITLLRIADQADQAIADVVNAIGVVQQPLAGDVEVQGIDGEVAALGVVFQAAIDVVAQDAAAFVAGRAAIAIVLAFRMMGAEGGDLDDLAAEVHVYQFEAAADDPRVAEFGADLLRRGAGGDIEVLGSDAEHLVAYAAPDHVGLVAGPLEDLDDLDGVPAELVPAQGVLVVTDDFRGCTDGARTAQGERMVWISFSAWMCYREHDVGDCTPALLKQDGRRVMLRHYQDLSGEACSVPVECLAPRRTGRPGRRNRLRHAS